MLHATIQWGTTVVCVTQDSLEMDTTVQVCSGEEELIVLCDVQ